MSWLYSRALVAAFSEATCSDGEPSALSSGNPTPQAYSSPDKTTTASRLSRYGMTCEPLTANRGAELLTWYRAGFPAKTSALPAKARALTVNEAECGERWRGWWAKYDPDSSLWKTAQCSLLGDSEQFLATWPASGSMRDGLCFQLPMLALPISEPASGSLLTPLKIDASLAMSLRDGYARNHAFGSLSEQLITLHNLRPSVAFVEKLMGWPATWTGLSPLAMGKFQEWQQQHSPRSPQLLSKAA